MENTYLALLPFELQDLIFKKVVKEQKKKLHAELIHELSNEVELGKVLVSENPTKYKKLIAVKDQTIIKIKLLPCKFHNLIPSYL